MRIEFESVENIEYWKYSTWESIFLFFESENSRNFFYLFVTSCQVNNNYQILDKRERELSYIKLQRNKIRDSFFY